MADATLMPAPDQRLPCETDVGRVVIHEKDLRQRFHRSGSPLLIVTTGRQTELGNKNTPVPFHRNLGERILREPGPIAGLTPPCRALAYLVIAIGTTQTGLEP
jgi:hypothetical protein